MSTPNCSPRLRHWIIAPICCLLGVSCLLAADSSATAKEDAASNMLNTEPIALEPITVKVIRERMKVYENATHDFWYATQDAKTVSYLDVMIVAYAKADFDVANTLLKKKQYREKLMPRGYDFFCNYAAINVQVPIAFKNTLGSAPALDPSSDARPYVTYNFKRKAIVIERENYYSSLMHASGISLCGFPSPESLERVKKIGAAKKDFEFRRQVNFEVQMQDLNRFYALYTRHPIMHPLEAVEALCMMEMDKRPTPKMVAQILKRNGFDVDPSSIDKILVNTKTKQSGGAYAMVSSVPGAANLGNESFAGAARLISGLRSQNEEVCTGLNRLSGKEYEAYLEHIVIEAPGHI